MASDPLDIIWNQTEFADKLEKDAERLADMAKDDPSMKVLRASIDERMMLLISLNL